MVNKLEGFCLVFKIIISHASFSLMHTLSLMDTQVQKLVEMGFTEDAVRSALESVGGDENLALEKLCSA